MPGGPHLRFCEPSGEIPLGYSTKVHKIGNHYEVDQALIGQRVELVFDPFDLATITVRYHDIDFGLVVPHKIGRHVHPMAKPASQSGPPTGIDYLGLVEARHRGAIGAPIGYSQLDHEPSTSAESTTRNGEPQ
jgi:putative transposase